MTVRKPLDICIVTCDTVGPIRNGGIGTAYYSLARMLAAAGHRVTVLYALGQFCENLIVEAAIPGAISRETGVRSSVVVGTPGTVMDLIRRRQFDVSQLKVLVIDEADNMLDQQGMGDQGIRVKGYVSGEDTVERDRVY